WSSDLCSSDLVRSARGVGRHSKNSGDRENCAQRPEHSQRHGGHKRAKQEEVHGLGPRFNKNRQACIEVTQPAPYLPTQLPGIATGTYQEKALARRRLQDRQKHCRLWLLGKARIFSVLYDTYHLDARSVSRLIVSADGVRRRRKHFARKRLVDHRQARRAFILMPGEGPSSQQRHLRRREEFRRDLVRYGRGGSIGRT